MHEKKKAQISGLNSAAAARSYFGLCAVVAWALAALVWAYLHGSPRDPSVSDLIVRAAGLVPFTISLIVWLCQLGTHP